MDKDRSRNTDRNPGFHKLYGLDLLNNNICAVFYNAVTTLPFWNIVKEMADDNGNEDIDLEDYSDDQVTSSRI